MSSRGSTNVVIVEGTCGSGKTTLLRAAESIFHDRPISVLFQRVTYAPIVAREDDGTLDDESNRVALLEVVRRIREAALESQRLVLVDTLHATHFVRAGALSIDSFVEVDRALEALGALVVVLHVGMDAIRTRAIVGRRGTGFYEYARKFGATEDDRLLYFAREQERLLALLATQSCLPQVVLDGEDAMDSLHGRFRCAVLQQLDV